MPDVVKLRPLLVMDENLVPVLVRTDFQHHPLPPLSETSSSSGREDDEDELPEEVNMNVVSIQCPPQTLLSDF